MNKQEVIERLNNKLDEVFAFQRSLKPLTWTHMECESKANAYMTAINYVEQLDEPQKVKVPELPSKIAKYLEWAKEEQFDFTEDYNMISWEDLRKFGGDDTEYLQMWFFDNDQKENERRHILFLQAYTDGYEVEEEQKYEVDFGHDTILYQADGEFWIEARENNEGVFKQEFTEKEIKSIDERYWAFAVPVEEVAE